MHKRNDELKALRIEEETQYIDIDSVEFIAKIVIEDLVDWANRNIYFPLGGVLSLRIDPLGPPNARAITFFEHPYKPTIEIRLSMFQEIYRDAFVFPLMSKRIETETETILNFHKSFPYPFDKRYMFISGVPEINPKSTAGNLNPVYKAFLKVAKEKPDNRISENDYACRFVMFEIVLAWMFFHELGHLVQRHYMLKGGEQNAVEVEIVEMDKNGGDEGIEAQAREVLADIEGLDLTLKYMKRKDILQPGSLYLLMCGINCMFQRFYKNYETNLDLCSGNHPHPIIRNEFFNQYILNWMSDFISEDKSLTALPLTYFSVRSSLMSGLYLANRLETFDENSLPTYMDLSSQNFESQRNTYLDIIKTELLDVIPKIKNIHMMQSNSVPLLVKILKIETN